MYQPPRPSIRATASAASSPRTNPIRSNNDREEGSHHERRKSYDAASSMSRAISDSGSDLTASQNSETRQTDHAKEVGKLNQIIQQFFAKSSLTIIGSRVVLPQAFTRNGDLRQNKWFNVILDESEELLNYMVEWRTAKVEEERPPPLIIEIYLDLAELTKSQSLVTIDEHGRRWDVAEALDPSALSSARAPGRAGITAQVVLERWEVQLDDVTDDSFIDKDGLAVVYKRAIPLFRSLYTYTRQLPAWKFYRKVVRQRDSQPALNPKYRVLSGASKRLPKNTLNIPLFPGDEKVTDTYEFEPLQCPAGTLSISVQYRTKCDFRVDDSESLLSSHFMGLDDGFFRPSLPGRQQDTVAVPSSVPTSRRGYMDEGRDQGQVYGSLSTFHKTGAPLGSSPLSAMRAMRDDDSTPSSSTPPQKMPPDHRTAQGPKSSLRSEAAPSYPRRTSVSFQPFKAGSLASSPAFGPQVPPSPSTSIGRTSGSGFNPLAQAHARNRSSLTTLPQMALRTPTLPNDSAIASSASSSPKPAPINRYSSSFSHRRSRFSTDGGSKGEHDQHSSGKPSPSSSTQPGSDLINEGQAGGSSGSMPQTDDDNLKDFLQLLEQKKDLKSFRNDSASRDASMKRTTAALSKYQRMRDSNTMGALSDSMSSSLLLHRSSSSSSRQLSSVPPMIHGTSVSTSSSPGKPVSPHTPHTPAIPSRLSVAEYSDARRSRSRGRRDAESSREEQSRDTTQDTGTTPIEIPTSPRAWPYSRRSNSVSQQQQRAALDDEPDLYGIRSASLPVDERGTELSLSELLRVNDGTSGPAEEGRSPEPESAGSQAFPFPTSRPESRQEMSRPSSAADPVQPIRSRLSRGRRGSPSFSSERGSRYSAGSRISTAPEEDELIFHLSELGSASRRSIEEGRGGGTSGNSDRRRGGSPYH